MKRKKLILAISMGLMLAINSSVLADPVSQTPSSPATGLSYEQQKSFEMEVSIEKLDNQIEQLMAQIDTQNKELSSKEGELKLQEERLKNLTKELDIQKSSLSSRVKAMYVSGNSTYLDVIFDAESMSDMIDRIDLVKKVIQHDKTIVTKYEDLKNNTEAEKKKLTEENRKLELLKKENEEKLKELETRKKTEKAILEQIKAREAAEAAERTRQAEISRQMALANNINTTGDTSESAKNMINKINSRKVGKTVNSSNITNFTGDDLVNFASNYLWLPYVWGGTTPSGFDFSGLVQYVYKHFGIDIPRTTYEQVKVGQTIPLEQLQPGDLLFFGGSEIHHVGMYVGEGQYIHAPRTGDVIKISSLSSRSDFTQLAWKSPHLLRVAWEGVLIVTCCS